ncbi:hypothetical protein ACFPT7_18920 [Acidicapsa dinghuensis]|uniref:Uncharacterized protein n=1 Tax=Acidicapsa dinghuensis TaxID=2218256 RepID=A0ABW1EJB5_9BACT|nr:hypothetical protein [Acidicapsa dinghuensis]
MVVDVKKLSDALRHSSPEEELRRDLERLIGARRQEINSALEAGRSFVLRVPDGRRIRISPRTAPEPATAQ